MSEPPANANDPDDDDRARAIPGADATPAREEITLEIDNYVLEWLNAQTGSLDDVINQVLHAYIAAEEAAAATPAAPAVTETPEEDDQ